MNDARVVFGRGLSIGFVVLAVTLACSREELHAAGITTLIVSVPAPLLAGEQRVAAYEAALQGYTNASVGLPVESHTEPTTLNIMCAASIDEHSARRHRHLPLSARSGGL